VWVERRKEIESMAKQASKTEKGLKKVAKKSGSGGSRSKGGSSRASGSSRSSKGDPVDALIKLLQSPLVIDLLAVGATAALAAITEHRSSRAQGAMDTRGSKKTLKAAGKAAATAVGRRLANEFDEIRTASKKARDSKGPKAGSTE
jgi:hypothetical protein